MGVGVFKDFPLMKSILSTPGSKEGIVI